MDLGPRLASLTYDTASLHTVPHEGRDVAVYRFRKAAAAVVWSEAAMEGNPITLVEVQTLMDGITVGGRKVADVDQVRRLIDAQRQLHALVRENGFRLGADVSRSLNATIARGEAPEAGVFRGEGEVVANISVSLADGTSYRPSPTEQGGANLRDLHDAILADCDTLDHPVVRAFHYHAHAIVAQFSYDGNKRTARHMMNGELMRCGYAPLVVSATKAREYHAALRLLFSDHDASPLAALLADSSLEPGRRVD